MSHPFASRMGQTASVAPDTTSRRLGALFRTLTRATLLAGCTGGCIASRATDDDLPGEEVTDEEVTDRDPDDEPSDPVRTARPDEAWATWAKDTSLEPPRAATVSTLGAAWQSIACEGGELVLPPEITSNRRLDYLAVYDVVPRFPGRSIAEPLARHGNACRGADELDACRQRLGAALAEAPAPCDSPKCDTVTAIVGVAGQFFSIASRAELLEWMGPVNTVAEAVVLALGDGYRLPCQAIDSELYDGDARKVRLVDGKIQLEVMIHETCSELIRQTLTIATDGLVNMRRERIASTPCTGHLT